MMNNTGMTVVAQRTEREMYDPDAAIRYAARELARLERVRRAARLLSCEVCLEDERAEAIREQCNVEAVDVKRQLRHVLDLADLDR